jgi:hypothetical protein
MQITANSKSQRCGGNKMSFINKIKRIMQGFKKNKETDFISEEDSTMIIEEELTEDESTEDEDQSTGAI